MNTYATHCYTLRISLSKDCVRYSFIHFNYDIYQMKYLILKLISSLYISIKYFLYIRLAHTWKLYLIIKSNNCENLFALCCEGEAHIFLIRPDSYYSWNTNCCLAEKYLNCIFILIWFLSQTVTTTTSSEQAFLADEIVQGSWLYIIFCSQLFTDMFNHMSS